MKVLLDTHVFLWANQAPDRLGGARELIDDPATELLLSSASSWELAIKVAIGRLSLPEPVEVYVPARMREIGMTSLVIEHAHALAVSKLPMHPHNPFDRMLVAQAMHVGVPIVTADEAFDRYEVDVIKTS